MKFACMLTFIFFVTFNAFADTKQERLDFNSYVSENYQILTHVKKPQKERKAFQPVEGRDPATDPKIGYDVDKTGHVAASSGSVWGSMGGQPDPTQQQQTQGQQVQQQMQQQQQQMQQSTGSSSSSSSGSSGGENLPQ